MAKTFSEIAAQGELTVFRIAELPVDIEPMPAANGCFIVGHSETGHHHVIDAGPEAALFVDRNDPLTMYLSVLASDVSSQKVSLRHERNHDNHEALEFEPGTYQINVSREFSLTGWRRVID